MGPRAEVVRPLDTIEAIFATLARYQAFQSAHLAVIEGPLDEALLTRALQRVQRRHPILNARIETDSHGYRFVPGPVVEAPWKVARGVHPIERPRHVEEALNTPITDEDPLPWRVALLQAPEGIRTHALILSAHHALMDGVGSLRVLEDLLGACADVLGGVPDREAPLAPLPPMDPRIHSPTMREWLRHKARGLRPLRQRRAPSYPFDGAAAPQVRRTGVVLLEVPPESLTRLLAESRRRGVTLNGVLTAVAVDSLTALFGDRGAVAISTQVNVRAHCVPEVPPTHVGCFVTDVVTEHSPHDRRDLWLRAREASAEIHLRAKSRAPLVAVAAGRGRVGALDRSTAVLAADHELQGRMGLLSMSNRGLIRTRPHGPFQLRALYSPASLHVVGPLLQLSFGSIDGTLYCALSHPRPLVSDRTARAFVHDFSQRLGALAPRRREAS